MWKVLKVSVSGYYHWLKASNSRFGIAGNDR